MVGTLLRIVLVAIVLAALMVRFALSASAQLLASSAMPRAALLALLVPGLLLP